MATIFEVSHGPSQNGLYGPFQEGGQSSWRDDLVPASFRGVRFFVDGYSKAGGRRVLTHQFPKKEYPYAEDMGRQAQEFTVRGYCIQFMYDAVNPYGNDQRYMRDYRLNRDTLMSELDRVVPGMLQLPTLPPIWVRCTRYSMAEDEQKGGYCTIDMTFTEFGASPNVDVPQTKDIVVGAAESVIAQAVLRMGPPPSQAATLSAPQILKGGFVAASQLVPVYYYPPGSTPPTTAGDIATKLTPVAYYVAAGSVQLPAPPLGQA